MRNDRVKRKDNKFSYDAGELRHKIEFFQILSTSDGYGGVTESRKSVLKTVCGKQLLSLNALYQANQLGLVGDATGFNQSLYATFRTRKGFSVTKDMECELDGVLHAVNGVIPMDDPDTFTRVMITKVKR